MEVNEIGPLIGESLKHGADKISDIYEKHAPRIWTGVCVAGAIFLPITSATAAIKSVRMIDAEEERLKRKLTVSEKIKLCWKSWIATTAAVGITAGSALMSLEESEKRIALMATGIQVLSEANKTDILNKVEEVAGKKKSDEISNRLAEDRVKGMAFENAQHTKFGDEPWLEPITGTDWIGDRNSLDAAVLRVNERFMEGEEVIFKDLFDEIGVECKSTLKWMKLSNKIMLRAPGMTRLPDGRVANLVSYYELPFDRESVFEVFNIRLWE